jgi:hypothetical protein
MNSQITGYQISYFVFSIFVSCIIVFTIHKGFQRQDIITIPIFAILLFLIIDFSAKSNYQNKMESFLNEGFNYEMLEQFTEKKQDKNKSYKFRTARPGLLASGTLINSGLEKDASEKEKINKVQCPPKNGKKGFWVCNEMTNINGQKRAGCGCIYGLENDDPTNLFSYLNNNNSEKNKSYKFRTARPGLMSSGTLINSGLGKDASEKEKINEVQCKPENGKKGFWVCNEMTNIKGQKRAGCGCVYDMDYNDKRNLFYNYNKSSTDDVTEETYQKYASVQDKPIATKESSSQMASSQRENAKKQSSQMKLSQRENSKKQFLQPESAQRKSDKNKVSQKQADNSQFSKKSVTPNADKKAKEAMNKQDERPDINKHLMDDGNGDLINRNSEANNPININVSYNNNRPYTINDFNSDIDKNLPERFKNNDINNYRFDDGNMNRTVKSRTNNTEQKYYPSNIKNPLNKNQSNKPNQTNQPKQSNQPNQPKVNENYELKRMRKILNEQNDPSPVILENSWSQWQPLDK